MTLESELEEQIRHFLRLFLYSNATFLAERLVSQVIVSLVADLMS